MGNDKSNITIGMPKDSGALFFAPAGTNLPTDADAPLGEEFVNLGYVSEDGITITTTEEGDDITAWGPEVVMRSQTNYGKTATFNLLETSRVGVLQFLYGADNVTLKEDGSIEWDETGEPLPRGVFVCDTLHNNGDKPRVHRQVLGDAQFTDRSGDHVYNNSDPLAFPVVLTAYKFTIGEKKMFVKNYLSKPVVVATEP